MLPGRSYLSCPVDGCGWRLDPEEGSASVRYVLPAGLPPGEAVEAAVGEVAHQRSTDVERRVREHAESHDVLDFLRTIQRLNQELGQQGSGVRPHRYHPKPEQRTMWKCGRCTVGFSPTPGDPDPTECPICGCPADR